MVVSFETDRPLQDVVAGVAPTVHQGVADFVAYGAQA
jgi:hypothetical protein